MNYLRPKGTNDISGAQSRVWRYVEGAVAKLCAEFGINELRTPMFEGTELFLRGIGETTDIVNKEMFSFEDSGCRSYTLRPEGTAGAVRAYIENGWSNDPKPVKLYYVSPCFRAERPAAGRYRQFTQFGVEYLGVKSPAADAELILLFDTLLKRLGVTGVELRLNSLGCSECRKRYNTMLREYLSANIDKLCATCQVRIEANPLRVLDCKEESCQALLKDIPSSLSSLCPDCASSFDRLKELLSAFGVKYAVDTRIVRGLDYYTGTVFEFVSSSLGAQSAVGGGGRYDNLIESLGGSDEGAVGFGLGLERLLMLIEAQKLELKPFAISFGHKPSVYVGSLGERGFMKSLDIAFKLRASGVIAEIDLAERGVKAQMKYADRKGFDYACLIGDDEVTSDKIKLKRLSSGEEICLSADEMSAYLWAV